MSSLKEFFTAENFKISMEKYCEQNGWGLADVNDKMAILVFEMKSGIENLIFISCYDEFFEFMVPSTFPEVTEDEIPHELSTILMMQNSRIDRGFWALREINSEFVFCLLNVIPFEQATFDYCQIVTRAMISECEEFEKALSKE